MLQRQILSAESKNFSYGDHRREVPQAPFSFDR